MILYLGAKVSKNLHIAKLSPKNVAFGCPIAHPTACKMLALTFFCQQNGGVTGKMRNFASE